MWKVHRGILSSYMMDREIGTWKVGNRNENHIINESEGTVPMKLWKHS